MNQYFKVLDKYQKKRKIKEYLDKFVEEDKLDESISKKLYDKLCELVNNNKIKKTSDVEYNKETFSIISIKCLKIDNNNYKLNI